MRGCDERINLEFVGQGGCRRANRRDAVTAEKLMSKHLTDYYFAPAAAAQTPGNALSH
jgi:hypothetical protein